MDERMWSDRAQRMEQVLRQILTLTALERAAGCATDATDAIEDIAQRALHHAPAARHATRTNPLRLGLPRGPRHDTTYLAKTT